MGTLEQELFAFVKRHGPLAPPVPHHGPNIFRRLFNRKIMRFAPAWLAANAVLGAWLNTGPYLAAGPRFGFEVKPTRRVGVRLYAEAAATLVRTSLRALTSTTCTAFAK